MMLVLNIVRRERLERLELAISQVQWSSSTLRTGSSDAICPSSLQAVLVMAE